jgi:subtilisin-like proprotein convertase family protein
MVQKNKGVGESDHNNKPHKAHSPTVSWLSSDPLYLNSTQWHLGFIGSWGFSLLPTASAAQGIEAIWKQYRGAAVSVGIWDDGVQSAHWDLSANYDASKRVVVYGTLNNGQPLSANNGHGTAVAGLIAADDNGLGGVGIAHDAQITSVRIFGGADDINNAWSRYLMTLDSLGQFDVTNHSYGGYPDFYTSGDVKKFEAAAVWGRGGLGTVNVKSAGNDDVDGNGDALDASRITLTVAAISESDTANIASYSTYGAHVLVSAPAASVTTDLLGNRQGYDGLLSGDYTNDFGGTSAAGPVTAGVVALMLDANPQLGWRDVHNILAYSAVGVGSRYSNVKTSENFAWKWNGASDWNGGGLHFSEDYGFGMVNALHAVRMAEVWGVLYPTAAVSANEAVVSTGVLTANKTIADVSTLSFNFTVSGAVLLEHVALTVSLTHTDFTDLRMRLISPDGTKLSLYDGSSGNSSTSDGTFTYAFGAEGFRGENSAGVWTLQVQDASSRDAGTLKSVAFAGYGSVVTNNNVYHYTSEVLEALRSAGQMSRLYLSDVAGTDWINAAAMVDDLVLVMQPGSTSTVGGLTFLSLAADTVIENAMGGDGHDAIAGNTADNLIFGMRGNDVLTGGAGLDVAGFMGSYSSYLITSADGVTTVSGVDGTDVLTGFEILRFDDGDWADPSAGIEPPDLVAPGLIGSNPADNAIAVPINTRLTLTFDEVVKAGTGSVGIYSGNGSLVELLDVGALLFVGPTVTLQSTVALLKDASYYVLVDPGAVLDASGNGFAGIVSATTLDFSTEKNVNLVEGTRRNDNLIGTSLNDVVSGLAGNDQLNGKLGNDTLTGGAGKDDFLFDTTLGPSNVDTITDFNVRDDTIRLENAIFTKLSQTGTLASGFFRANAGGLAQDSNDYILLDTTSGKLYYDADGKGALQAVHFASLVDLTGTMTVSDFVVV